MRHVSLITRETLIEDHRARRERMAQNAVCDDGFVHPKQRKPQYVRHYQIIKDEVPPFSFRAFFERANRIHPLPKPFKPQLEPMGAYFNAQPIEDEEAPVAAKCPRVCDIQKVVADHYGVTLFDLISARRFADITKPRQIAMYLAKVLTLRSLPDIGRRFGDRDHTTVLHAVRKIGAMVESDPAFGNEVDALRSQILELENA
jgi:hypothetical protein